MNALAELQTQFIGDRSGRAFLERDRGPTLAAGRFINQLRLVVQTGQRFQRREQSLRAVEHDHLLLADVDSPGQEILEENPAEHKHRHDHQRDDEGLGTHQRLIFATGDDPDLTHGKPFPR